MASYGDALARKQALADQEFSGKVAEHAAALNGLRDRLSGLPAGSAQYADTFNQMQGIVHELREMYHPDHNPGAIAKFGHILTDALRITNPQQRIRKVAARRAAGVASDEQEAQEIAEAAPPSAQEQAVEQAQAQNAGKLASIQGVLKAIPTFFPGATPEQLQRFHDEYLNHEFGIAAKPVLKEYQQFGNPAIKAWLDATQPIPGGWTATGANIKPVRGTLVRSTQSPTGFAQTWVDPMNPSQIVGWQPVTPSRYYMGTVTRGTTTDPFGVTTTSMRRTAPADQANVDLSGVAQISPSMDESASSQPPSPSGAPQPAAPNAPPAGASRGKASGKVQSIAELRKQAAARAQQGAPQLDAEGHIPPAPGMNEGLRNAANQLLDGMDIDKLPLPARDKQAAAALASQYGWGQGLFTPKERLLVRESKNYLTQALNDRALTVLDNPVSRAKLANMLLEHKGIISSAVAATFGLNAQEQGFLRMYNQLVGTISGLGQLTRGGRVTEATIARLMRELPNPEQSHSSADAKQRIQRLLSEIDVAVNQGQGIDAAGAGTGSAAEFLKNFRAGGKQ